ncbi:MAG: phosphopantetheine-binding protein [Chitinophagales bacterium]|nr:acyl carrier protein [Bacteroidota bacterium]MCB9225789.1 acyl carrier protein [Chitinophagales bacterium]
MTEAEIIDKINDFLIEEFEVEESEIIPEANLKETLELDSLDFVDLVVIIESNFGFKVVAEDFVDIITFQDFYNYIIQKLAVENQ